MKKLNRKTGKGFRFNKLRKWSRAKGSFFIVKNQRGSIPPPADSGYILQENGAVVLGEDTAKLIVES